MRQHDLTNARWRKSSYSNGEGGDCVEVADGVPNTVPVRDSKLQDGPVLLLLTTSSWTHFIDAVGAARSGQKIPLPLQ
ncbi:DUF397 domain-containing protein [Streptomyces sp. NPDC048242]|uniref:DUF397 domain-containing protein n=1 Tax=Streptomyces sp. NPDC048242 TaxID=3155026 RepID=UPI00342AA840